MISEIICLFRCHENINPDIFLNIYQVVHHVTKLWRNCFLVHGKLDDPKVAQPHSRRHIKGKLLLMHKIHHNMEAPPMDCRAPIVHVPTKGHIYTLFLQASQYFDPCSDVAQQKSNFLINDLTLHDKMVLKMLFGMSTG